LSRQKLLATNPVTWLHHMLYDRILYFIIYINTF